MFKSTQRMVEVCSSAHSMLVACNGNLASALRHSKELLPNMADSYSIEYQKDVIAVLEAMLIEVRQELEELYSL